jgi:hypothetical protein
LLGDIVDEFGADRAMWGLDGDEDVTAADRSSTATQIADQRLAHIGRQRQPTLAAPLAAHDDLTGPPVEITQLEPSDLNRAQPESCDQAQHREVADANISGAVAMVQQRLDISSGHPRRHTRQPPPTHRRHRGPQPARDDLPHEQVAQQ